MRGCGGADGGLVRRIENPALVERSLKLIDETEVGAHHRGALGQKVSDDCTPDTLGSARHEADLAG
jgi:hypothetical protein